VVHEWQTAVSRRRSTIRQVISCLRRRRRRKRGRCPLRTSAIHYPTSYACYSGPHNASTFAGLLKNAFQIPRDSLGSGSPESINARDVHERWMAFPSGAWLVVVHDRSEVKPRKVACASARFALVSCRCLRESSQGTTFSVSSRLCNRSCVVVFPCQKGTVRLLLKRLIKTITQRDNRRKHGPQNAPPHQGNARLLASAM
jgi:hypothetical protein